MVFIQGLQSFAGKLPFHGQSREQFLSHEAQAFRLHRALIAEKLHSDWLLLTDSPGPTAGLAQGVQRVSGFMKDDCGREQQIETGF
jgi:hypothetical protein